MSTCYYCGEPGDLRPYGPRASMVCFPCVTAAPDREAEAQRQFGTQLNSCGDVAVIDGSQVGPYPLAHAQEQEADT